MPLRPLCYRFCGGVGSEASSLREGVFFLVLQSWKLPKFGQRKSACFRSVRTRGKQAARPKTPKISMTRSPYISARPPAVWVAYRHTSKTLMTSRDHSLPFFSGSAHKMLRLCGIVVQGAVTRGQSASQPVSQSVRVLVMIMCSISCTSTRVQGSSPQMASFTPRRPSLLSPLHFHTSPTHAPPCGR